MDVYESATLSNHPLKYCISFSFPLISGLILVGLAFYINFHDWNMIHLSAPESDSLRNSYFTPVKSFVTLFFFISSCPPAGFDIRWHIRGRGEGSNRQLLFLLDLPSVRSGSRPLLRLGSCQQGVCGGLQQPDQSVSITRRLLLLLSRWPR